MPLQHLASSYGPHRNAHTWAVHMHHLSHTNTYTHWLCHRFHGELRSCRRMWEFLSFPRSLPWIHKLDLIINSPVFQRNKLKLKNIGNQIFALCSPWRLSGSMGTLEWMNRQALIKTELSHMHAVFSILPDWQRTEALCMGKGMKNGTGNHASVERKKKSFLIKIKCPL